MKCSLPQTPVPLPFAGFLLGSLGLGNLLTGVYPPMGWLVSLFSSFLWLGFTMQFPLYWRYYREQLKSAPALSSFATYPMASMQVAAFLGDAVLAPLLWWLALFLHLGLIVLFTRRYVFMKSWDQLSPTWTVLYVGIAMATVTAGVGHAVLLGRLIWCFALIAALILAIFLLSQVRSLIHHDQLLPQWAILTAPFSLLLLASIRLEILDSNLFLILLAQSFYLLVVSLLPKMLKKTFSPAHSALTFPLVVTALALTASQVPQLAWLAILETIVAAVVVLYVGWNYMKIAFRNS